MHLWFSSLFKVSVIGLSVYVIVCHWGGQLDRESWYNYTVKDSLTCQSWLSRPGSCLPCGFYCFYRFWCFVFRFFSFLLDLPIARFYPVTLLGFYLFLKFAISTGPFGLFIRLFGLFNFSDPFGLFNFCIGPFGLFNFCSNF